MTCFAVRWYDANLHAAGYAFILFIRIFVGCRPCAIEKPMALHSCHYYVLASTSDLQTALVILAMRPKTRRRKIKDSNLVPTVN